MRNYFALLLSVALPLFSRAQESDSKWNQARDYLNCKVSLAILKKREKEEGIKKFPPSLSDAENSLDQVTIETAIDYAELEQVLKGFPMVLKQLSGPIHKLDLKPMEKMTDPKTGVQELVDSVYSILKRGYAKQFETVRGETKDGLKADVEKYLVPGVVASAAPARSVYNMNDPDNVQKTEPEADNAKKNAHGQATHRGNFFTGGGFNFWVLLLLGAIIGLGVYLERNWRKLYRQLDYEKKSSAGKGASSKEYTSDLAMGHTSGLSKREVGQLITDSLVIADLKNAINELRYQVLTLQNQEEARVAEAKKTVSQVGYAQQGKQEITRGDLFYMAGPVGNYFPNSAKSLSKENTVYKFSVSSNRQEASFEIHTSGAPVMEIVRMAESYIKSACDEENLPGHTVRNITTKMPGLATLENDRWIIKRKALIRYE